MKILQPKQSNAVIFIEKTIILKTLYVKNTIKTNKTKSYNNLLQKKLHSNFLVYKKYLFLKFINTIM